MKQASVVCYGEVLWDIFPGSAKPGGAPMNVAYHLNKLGLQSHMISRVGNDDLGRQLLQQLQHWNISTQWCQQDIQYPTGTVLATEGADHEMSYDIIKPVAWDYIEWKDELDPLLKHADALVFGSLATRNETSYHTLLSLLEISSFRIFDINIRPPHSNIDIIKLLLAETDLVKMNLSELELLLCEEGISAASITEGAQKLLEKYEFSGMIITKGSQGAMFLDSTTFCERPAYQVTVKDTVGSGDAFLAGFLSRYLHGNMAEPAMDFATGLSAFVTTQEGACPDYEPAQLPQLFASLA
ncbi:MAG TPA: carbohydrate kinase [Chitinophaga sp.]|uniref:carbohydrate kinase family protein n=1 Tax=Chitinophaga sp. TaxID=1869181 RepID=UPI002CCACC7F|nr:carbohydrate kinase [Chitinophaga sp.]HVI44023.1 carbohydrate kinase [Chitinophaga sp.]